MLYNFVDTVEHTSQSILPAEAMQFNGEYIENLIQGYRTLYVKGRDVLSPEVEVGEVGVRNGAYLKNKRFPARTITVGYQLLASNEEDFRAKFNALNDILNTEDAQLIFKDEDDKYFTGTPNGYSDVPEGRNSITAEFEIICTDPFKYSVEEYEVDAEGDTITVDYNGTYPSYPTLEADFYKSESEDNTDGDCGYVAFINQEGSVLQFGNAMETDEIANKVENLITTSSTAQITKQQRLINDIFTGSITPWNNAGFISNPDVNRRAGAIKLGIIGGGTEKALQPNGYGADNSPAWHGPTACKAVGSLPPVSGASNPTRSGDFTLSFKLRFAPNKDEATAKRQAGKFECWVGANATSYLTGIMVWKNSSTNKGTVSIYVAGHGAVKTWANVDLGHLNPYFGYKVPSPKMGVTITKQGSKLTYNIGGLTFSYTATNLTTAVAQNVMFFFGKWKAVNPLDFLGVFAVAFTDTAAKYTVQTTSQHVEYLTEILDQENTFSTNDILLADCGSATTWLTADGTTEGNGTERPDLGALGNDWEKFTLSKGENVILTAYSDWVADEHKPTFKLRYRERYL